MSVHNSGNTAAGSTAPITPTIGVDLSRPQSFGGDGAPLAEAPTIESAPSLVGLTGDHSRTAQAEADEATKGVLVNRSKGGESPFVEIVKTPTFAQNSGNLTGYAVEIADATAGSGYRHVGSVSEGYLLLPNLKVRELALEIARRTGLGFQEAKIYWDGRRFLHVVEFDKSESVSPGDDVALSLITRSSYDKSWRFDMAIGAIRLVCSNGMISGDYFSRVSFKHAAGRTGAVGAGGAERRFYVDEETWEGAVEQGLSLIESAPSNLSRFVRGLQRLRGVAMTDDVLRSVWAHLPALPDGLRGRIMSQYLQHEDPTLYGLLNASTASLWHGRPTAQDFSHNDAVVTSFLDYAFENVN